MGPISTRLYRCFHAGIAAVLVAAISGGAVAQTYPVKPIRLIVPAAPGSTADIESRFVAQELSEALGQPEHGALAAVPSVPTLDEQGIKDYEVNAWAGFVAPAGTPPKIVGRLNAELIKIFPERGNEGKA